VGNGARRRPEARIGRDRRRSPPARRSTTYGAKTAYLLGALAGCAVAFLHDTLAPGFDVQIDDVTAVARGSSDARGLLGLDGVAPDLADLSLEIKVSSPSPKDRVDAMLAAWRDRCPIYLALLKSQSIALTTA
jgi:uncharacterized OsmC-like protein